MAAREDVVRLALAQLGQAAPDGDDQYIRWFNGVTGIGFALDGTEWCSIWVTWVYSMAGVDTVPITAGCTTARSWYRSHGRWAEAAHTPRPGDAIYFDWDLTGDCDHVGIVEQVENGRVHTIEGNSGNRVAQRVYDLHDPRIAGYGLPDFEEVEKVENYGGAPQWLIDEGAAQWLVETGVFKGDEAGEMHWNESITRAECGALIYRLAKLAGLA